MKKVYPIILTENDGMFVVTVPDLEIGSQGATVQEAIDMARDAIGLWGISMQDLKQPIPEPKTLKLTCSENEFVALVDVDFDDFRNAEKLVRKNCTIPQWLNDEAEHARINFSAVLQKALKAELLID